MTTITLPNSLYNEANQASRLNGRLRRWKLAFGFSGLIGLSGGLAGTLLGSMSLLGLLATHPFLDRAGTVLLVLAFVLLIFAAHCLDKANKINDALRHEYSKQTGIASDL